MPKSEQSVECLSTGWTVTTIATGSARRGGTTAADPLVDKLVKGGRVLVAHALAATSDARRGPAARSLEIGVTGGSGEVFVLAVRHPSGALTFHAPQLTERRGGHRGKARHRFSVPISPGPAEDARRGIFGKVVKIVILKIAGKLADKAFPVLARLWEQASWKAHKLHEGWLQVSLKALESKSLPAADLSKLASPPLRNLLMIHGTFSHAESAFSGLSTSLGSDGRDFFSAVQPIYGDRIFAFNHFTLSRSPEDNARMLLDALPDRRTIFDCVTHSRGGLVLRHLAELPSLFGDLSNRFELGRAVLVASPNQGTPLASPQRFDTLLGWLSNLIDLFPDNPFTFGIDFIAEGLTWLANRVAGSLPGLAAMDSNGPVIAALQAPPNPPAGAYSALVANFEPDQGLLLRMADAGVDVFFNSANDLVVPTEGGWRVDPQDGAVVPGDRIGVFGRGGNEDSSRPGAVIHTTFFQRSETVDFLVRALRGDPQPLSAVSTNQDLPFLRRRGGGAGLTDADARPSPTSAAPSVAASPPQPGTRAAQVAREANPRGAYGPEAAHSEIFYLSFQPSDSDGKTVDLAATFRNARVLERMVNRGESGRHWFEVMVAINDMQKRIQTYIDGKPRSTLPNDDELVEFGCRLFQVLLPGEARRLYDAARAMQAGRRLNIVFTSMIDWIADKPWEFAYDPGRANFLAVEDINFIRNARTAIPADRIQPRPAPLRILVVVAQPLGTSHLSVDEEVSVIRSGFQNLLDANLAEVDVLLDATPGALHRQLESANDPIDVLHFIGHGFYDKEADLGYLIFENDLGQEQRLDSQVLRQIICRRDIRLVFLNACESGTGGKDNFNKGVAPALVAGGVPAVVANQYSVLDSSATSFARHFYWALAQGHSIGDAARESRVAVNYSVSREIIDWAVPVVYALNPDDVLCLPGTAPAFDETTNVIERRARRSAFGEKKIIGLWDVNRVIPGLDRIADKLTQSQPMFGFQVISFSAPLGSWQREQKGNLAYLRADQLAERLRSKPDELGVEELICITNLPISDAETRNLIAWYDDPNERISVFSTYGLLDQINPPELSIERMIANAGAGFLGKLPAHRRGRKTCPYYYNAERDIKFIAGRLELCAPDRRRIKNAKLRAALESLLNVYN